jgi:hypothetical protein
MKKVCNKCSEDCCLGNEYVSDPYGLIDAEVSGGYFSKELMDMTSYKFSLCESCLKELFSAFKVPVEEKSLEGESSL